MHRSNACCTVVRTLRSCVRFRRACALVHARAACRVCMCMCAAHDAAHHGYHRAASCSNTPARVLLRERHWSRGPLLFSSLLFTSVLFSLPSIPSGPNLLQFLSSVLPFRTPWSSHTLLNIVAPPLTHPPCPSHGSIQEPARQAVSIHQHKTSSAPVGCAYHLPGALCTNLGMSEPVHDPDRPVCPALSGYRLLGRPPVRP